MTLSYGLQVYGCIGVHLVWEHFSETSLQIQDSNNSGLKLSDIIVILCSKLLDYILLKSGSGY